MSIEWFDRPTLDRMIKYKILRSDIVLDIGCGIRPQSFFKPFIHICCEPHEEYIQILKQQYSGSNFIIFQKTAFDLLTCLPNKSIDSIFMLDFIEHVEKEEGKKILSECERIARVQIILVTPLGFMPQEYGDGDEDSWGLHGAQWQRHKSGWTPEDFDESWNISGARIYHTINGRGEVYDPTFGAFWAIKNQQVHEPAAPLLGESMASKSLQAQKDDEGILDVQHTLGQITAQIDHHIIELIRSYEDQTLKRLNHREIQLDMTELRLNNREAMLNKREAELNLGEIELNQKKIELNQRFGS